MKEEAYDKEFGLTRHERLKKMCLEEMIDEIFVVKYDVFVEICKQLHKMCIRDRYYILHEYHKCKIPVNLDFEYVL